MKAITSGLLILGASAMVVTACGGKKNSDAATKTAEQTQQPAAPSEAAATTAKVTKSKDALSPKGQELAGILARTLDIQSQLLTVLEENGDDADKAAAEITAFLKAKDVPIARLQKALESLRQAMVDDPSLGPKIMKTQRKRVQDLAKRTAALTAAHPELMQRQEVLVAMKALAPKQSPKPPAGKPEAHGHDHAGHSHGPRAALPGDDPQAKDPNVKPLTDEELTTLGGLLTHEEKLVSLMETYAKEPKTAAKAMMEYLKSHAEEIKALATLGAKLRTNPDAARAYTLAHQKQVTMAHERMRNLTSKHPELMKNASIIKALVSLRRP